MPLTAGSLFSGCGGMDLGFESAGFDIRWQCELDKWCSKILDLNWPRTPNYKDVNLLENFTSGRNKVDVLIGGFPCQPVSAAGRKDGINDPRWLWPAYHRAIRILRPRFVVVENVPGLFKRGFGEVIGSLARSGYDAEWFSLQSSDIGAPHRRKRVYIIAADARSTRRWEERGSALSNETEVGESKDDYFPGSIGQSKFPPALNEKITNTYSKRRNKSEQEFVVQLFKQENQNASNSNGERLERFAENNGQNKGLEVQRRDDISGRDTASTHAYSEHDNWPWTPRERGWDESTDGYFGDYETAIRQWENLTRPAPNPKDEKERVSVEFVEWMMGFPEGWTEGVSRTQRLKMLGNAVQVQCAEVVANILKQKVTYE